MLIDDQHHQQQQSRSIGKPLPTLPAPLLSAPKKLHTLPTPSAFPRPKIPSKPKECTDEEVTVAIKPDYPLALSLPTALPHYTSGMPGMPSAQSCSGRATLVFKVQWRLCISIAACASPATNSTAQTHSTALVQRKRIAPVQHQVRSVL